LKETAAEHQKRVGIRPIPGRGEHANTGVLVHRSESRVSRRPAGAETRLSKQGLLRGMRDQEYKALPDGHITGEKRYI